MAYLSWPFALFHGLNAGRAAKSWVVVSYLACVLLVVVALLVRFSVHLGKRSREQHQAAALQPAMARPRPAEGRAGPACWPAWVRQGATGPPGGDHDRRLGRAGRGRRGRAETAAPVRPRRAGTGPADVDGRSEPAGPPCPVGARARLGCGETRPAAIRRRGRGRPAPARATRGAEPEPGDPAARARGRGGPAGRYRGRGRRRGLPPGPRARWTPATRRRPQRTGRARGAVGQPAPVGERRAADLRGPDLRRADLRRSGVSGPISAAPRSGSGRHSAEDDVPEEPDYWRPPARVRRRTDAPVDDTPTLVDLASRRALPASRREPVRRKRRKASADAVDGAYWAGLRGEAK